MAAATLAWLRQHLWGAHPRTKATWPAAAVRQFYIHRLGNCPTSPASCTAMPGPPVVAMSVSHRGLSPQTALSVRGARSCAGRARHLDNAGNGRNQSSQMIGRTKLCRRAAQRLGARGRVRDIDDEATSSRVPSPVTPATFTDSKYTSHARAPRRLQQRVIGAPRRRATSVPPRVRVALLSKSGTLSYPPSPPVDEFTDIPPVDLIVFEPRMSVTAGCTTARFTSTGSENVTTQRHMSSSEGTSP
ncbi:hypothetical protein MTO96_008468 [Rhipicephalus appendiculatus]